MTTESGTPRTDALVIADSQLKFHNYASSYIELCRQLERELATCKKTSERYLEGGGRWERRALASELSEKAANARADEVEQHNIGMCAAWKRDYDGEKERGDKWMADCKAAEQSLAEVRRDAARYQVARSFGHGIGSWRDGKFYHDLYDAADASMDAAIQRGREAQDSTKGETK